MVDQPCFTPQTYRQARSWTYWAYWKVTEVWIRDSVRM